jgi:hypothetical protein
MVGSWESLLEGSGARLSDGGVVDFGDPHAEAGAAGAQTVVAPLADRALIGLEGDPAESFLQTQLTCDVREATDASSILGAYCNPKGRVLSVFRLFRWHGRFVASLRADAADTTEKRLTLYRMRTPVSIERMDDVASFGLSGPGASEALSKAGLPAPEAGEVSVAEGGRAVVLGMPAAGHPRFQIHAGWDDAPGLWAALRDAARPVGTPVWRLEAIRTGELDVPPALCEGFTANMLNLNELGAVKFEKGCFPGQEVVARTHHLGKVPRRLRHAAIEESKVPEPGTKLSAYRGEQARDAGVVVEAAPAGPDRVELLAVVAEAQLDADAIRVGEEPDDPALRDLRTITELGVSRP